MFHQHCTNTGVFSSQHNRFLLALYISVYQYLSSIYQYLSIYLSMYVSMYICFYVSIYVCMYLSNIIETSELKMATTLNLFLRHLGVRRYDTSLTKIQGFFTTVKFLGGQRYKACRNILFKVKGKSLHLTTPGTIKEAQRLVGLFGFGRQDIPHLGVLLWPIYGPI